MAAAEKTDFSFAYLQREGDPAYEGHRAYTGLVLRDRFPGLDGAKAAARESRLVGRALGLSFKLHEQVLAPGEDALAAVKGLIDQGTSRVFLLDLPLTEVRDLAGSLEGEDVLMFNIRHRDDSLRGAGCSPVLFHTLPSNAMLMDGLVQFLRKRNWLRVLVLEGEGDEDKALSAAFQASARKFQLRVLGVRPFVLSNDPRQRDRTNVRLMTSATDYDVIFLADTIGEFGRYVPFGTQLARPVVGTEGLRSSAWHWAWERHGAPQFNQRFDRVAKRRMSGQDWAAWAAVRAVVEAAVRTKATAIAELRSFLRSEQFALDTYKGAPGSFRPWDNQLRQPVLLHTHNAVIARAPVEGYLHQRNNLDTLGADLPESECKL